MNDSVDPDRRLHDIYRMRDLSGRLLYVGVTNGGLRRFMEHSKDKTWWREVATIDVEHVHCSRPVIEAIEREAIRAERPIYNVVHNARTELPPPVVMPEITAPLGGRTHDAVVVLAALDMGGGVTTGEWLAACALPERTFYRRRKELLDGGAVVQVGTESQPRYKVARSSANDADAASSRLDLKLGDVVEHPAFGVGVIRSLDGSGENRQAEVYFWSTGTKYLAVAWAPLEIIADPLGFLAPFGGEG